MANDQQDWSSVTPAHWSLKTGPVITQENKSVYLAVAWLLAIIVIMSLGGIIGLAYLDKQIPQALIALGSVAVGALGSLFTHSK
jgi:hypothetical protein